MIEYERELWGYRLTYISCAIATPKETVEGFMILFTSSTKMIVAVAQNLYIKLNYHHKLKNIPSCNFVAVIINMKAIKTGLIRCMHFRP